MLTISEDSGAVEYSNGVRAASALGPPPRRSS
jgi:hypothetical protein